MPQWNAINLAGCTAHENLHFSKTTQCMQGTLSPLWWLWFQNKIRPILLLSMSGGILSTLYIPSCFIFSKIHAWVLSHVWLFVAPWTINCQAPLSMGFPRQEYWHGLPFPSPGDLPDPGIEPRSPASPALAADSLPPCHLGSPSTEVGIIIHTVQLSEQVWESRIAKLWD